MHQETWVHRHLRAPQLCLRSWMAEAPSTVVHSPAVCGAFQDDGAYHKWRVQLVRDVPSSTSAPPPSRSQRERGTTLTRADVFRQRPERRELMHEQILEAQGRQRSARGWSEISQHRRFSSENINNKNNNLKHRNSRRRPYEPPNVCKHPFRITTTPAWLRLLASPTA